MPLTIFRFISLLINLKCINRRTINVDCLYTYPTLTHINDGIVILWDWRYYHVPFLTKMILQFIISLLRFIKMSIRLLSI